LRGSLRAPVGTPPARRVAHSTRPLISLAKLTRYSDRMPKTLPDLASAEDAAAVNTLRMGVLRLARRLRHLRVDRTLSLAEMSAIGTLVRCGAMTLGELARSEHVQPPSMTRIIAVL